MKLWKYDLSDIIKQTFNSLSMVNLLIKKKQTQKPGFFFSLGLMLAANAYTAKEARKYDMVQQRENSAIFNAERFLKNEKNIDKRPHRLNLTLLTTCLSWPA